MDGALILSTLQNGHHAATAVRVGTILRSSIVATTVPVTCHPSLQVLGEEEDEMGEGDESLSKNCLMGDEEVVQS